MKLIGLEFFCLAQGVFIFSKRYFLVVLPIEKLFYYIIFYVYSPETPVQRLCTVVQGL